MKQEAGRTQMQWQRLAMVGFRSKAMKLIWIRENLLLEVECLRIYSWVLRTKFTR